MTVFVQVVSIHSTLYITEMCIASILQLTQPVGLFNRWSLLKIKWLEVVLFSRRYDSIYNVNMTTQKINDTVETQNKKAFLVS